MWYQQTNFDEANQKKAAKPAKTALVAAVDILARQEHSENKLREKLIRKGYAEAEINQAIDRLQEKHYLCDEDACARQFDIFIRKAVNQSGKFV